MEKLVLVRYGQYENDQLTDEGKAVMRAAAERIKEFLGQTKPLVITASTNRAIESAKIVGDALETGQVGAYPEIYAADEEGRFADCAVAARLIETLGAKNPVIVAIASREYIDMLPSWILENELGSGEIKTSLNRGEALVLDYKTRTVSYLR